MSSPTGPAAPALLLDMPLEIRHTIFSHVAAARSIQPRYTLRYWFEKTDIQEQIAKNLESHPDADVTYVAGYNHQYDYEDEPPVQDGAEGDDDGEDDEDEEQDQDGQDGEDDGDAIDEDEDSIDDDDEVMSDEEVDLANGAAAVPNNVQGGDTATTSVDPHQPTMENNQTVEDICVPIPAPTVAMADAQVADPEAEHGTDDADMDDAGEDDTTTADGRAAEGEADAATASSNLPARQTVVVKPNHKWRHVSKFMRLTQCPPQTDLFLISKQLSVEAKKWFYDVATLHIDATASFCHFTFFELALNKIAETPFSPMENIKNAEITFVWDTTWIRAESTGFAGAVFPVFLKSRADFILEILLRAPELQKLKIIWHDSAQDDGAMQLRADTLEPFIMNLNVDVETEDHYIAPDAKPRASSGAGKQRLEFQALFDNGCETF